VFPRFNRGTGQTRPEIEGSEQFDRFDLKEGRSLTSITKCWENSVGLAFFPRSIQYLRDQKGHREEELVENKVLFDFELIVQTR
jgi:hypothetical protein